MHDYQPLRALIAGIILLGCGLGWIVQAENEIETLEYRLNHVESRLRSLDPPAEPSDLCVPYCLFKRKGEDFRWLTKEEYLKQTGGEEEGKRRLETLPPGQGWAYWWGPSRGD